MVKYGARAGVCRISRLLKECGVKCTSYMVGLALQMNPEVEQGMNAACHELNAIAATASLPGLQFIERITWGRGWGKFSIFIAILVCCVGVATLDKP